MNKDSKDRIERIFREGLSDHTDIVSADLDVPEGTWINIENALDAPKSNRRGGFVGLILALVGFGVLVGFSIYTMAQMTNFQYLEFLAIPDSLILPHISSEGSMIDVFIPSKTASAREEVVQIENQKDQSRDPISRNRGLAISPHVANQVNDDQESDVARKAFPFLSTKEIEEDTYLQNNKDGAEIELEDFPAFRNFGLLSSVSGEMSPLAKSDVVVEGLEGELKSSKYWTAQLGAGMRSNDYFIQGNFSIDPNTQFNVEKRWSPEVFLTASYFMGKSFSLDAGLHFTPIQTTAKYVFTLPYSTAEEEIVGNIAFRSINHNIPSVDGGLAAETRLERNVEATVEDGEEVVLNADVDQTQHIISLPLSARLRLLNLGNLHVSAGVGINFNLQISQLKSEVTNLESSLEQISYRELVLTPLDTRSSKSFFMGYQFGIDTQYFIDNSGTFISGSLTYSNALSPIFSFDNVNVYPRSLAVGIGIGKKF
ncbi:MAG: hypothetical protein HKN87_14610 [Saprospiraceae bacterium]|nr:hypothetical protein [Saprospiraceae bacterium]